MVNFLAFVSFVRIGVKLRRKLEFVTLNTCFWYMNNTRIYHMNKIIRQFSLTVFISELRISKRFCPVAVKGVLCGPSGPSGNQLGERH